MKNFLIGATACAALIAAAGVSAQTCTPTAGAFTGANSGSTAGPFDTCALTNQMALNCSGLNPIGAAQDAVFSVKIGPGAHSGNFVISTTTPTYDIYVGLMSTACAAGSPCPLEADSNPAGGSETLGPIDGLANGDYWMLVTSFGAQCGSISIAVPTLPVALQGFSVE